MTSTAALDRQMREVLLQLAVCSHVPASGYQPRGRSGATDSRLLIGGDTGNLTFARAYGRPFAQPTAGHPGARDDHERQAVLDEARAELEHLRRGSADIELQEESLDELYDRIVHAGEGYTVKEVAFSLRVGERVVISARKARGRDTGLGKALTNQQSLSRDDRREKARELRDKKGLSYRAIALILGVPKSTIADDLAQDGRLVAA